MTKSKQKKLDPIYLLIGDDEQKKSALLARMKDRCKEFGEMEINTDVFDGETHQPERAVSACLTLPFASDKRLVIIKDVDKYNAAELNVLADYATEPSDTSILLLLATKLAKNTRLYKRVIAISENAVIPCDSPKPWEFEKYAIDVAKTKGVRLLDSGAKKLVELVGQDTTKITNELSKIIASHSSSRPIDQVEVESLVAASAEVKVWVLADAFAARNLTKVIELLPRVMGTTPSGVLYYCVARARELICAKECLKSGTSNINERIAKELGLPASLSWRVKQHAAWSRQFSTEELKRAIKTSVEAEIEMKRGGDPVAVLTLWLAKTLG